MHIFEHKNTHYLSLKDHTFEILNGFRMGYSGDYLYIQCTTNSSSGIIQEYLPKGWGLSKKKYNGQMIFTLYKKNSFAYKSKSKSLGTVCFVAFSDDGAKYLLHRWILNEQLGLDDNDINIAIVSDEIRHRVSSLTKIDSEQKMYGSRINMNDWQIEGILSSIERKINEEVA
jgi:hypothetical protein